MKREMNVLCVGGIAGVARAQRQRNAAAYRQTQQVSSQEQQLEQERLRLERERLRLEKAKQ